MERGRRVRTPAMAVPRMALSLRSCPSVTIRKLHTWLFQRQRSFIDGSSCVFAKSIAVDNQPSNFEI